MSDAPQREAVRQKVLRGGRYLILRQGIGLGIGVVGVLLLTRLLGPTDYGLYVGSLAVVTFVAELAGLGVAVHLVRREEPPDRYVYSQAFTLLLLAGMAVAGLGLLVGPLLRLWLEDGRFILPLQVLLLGVPLMLISDLAFAALERHLDFRKVAFLELVGQLLFYGAAIPLAVYIKSVWVPVAAFWCWQTWLAVAGFWVARLRPRLAWSPPLIREMLGYGISYSTANWIWNARLLVNPLIVGRYLGPEGVAYVHLATRIVEVLSFVRAATWRLSIAALAKVQRDLVRLRRVTEEATMLQVIGVAPLLCIGAVGVLVLPRVLGPSWEPVVGIFPFVALAALVNAGFSMHSSALYVLRRNGQVAVFHLVYVGLLAVGALLLVPRIGLLGYGLAEMVAMAAYVIIHQHVMRLFPFSFRSSVPWFLAFAPPIFVTTVPLPYALLLFLPTIALLSLGRFRAVLGHYIGQLRPRAVKG